MSRALLEGLAVALNAHLTDVRAHLDTLDDHALRDRLALAVAMADIGRAQVGETAVAAHQAEARQRVQERVITKVSAAVGYGLWAEVYDHELNPVITQEEPVLLQLLGDVAGLRILDVGCGTGRWALRLAQMGGEVTATDPCPQMLARAREKAVQGSVRIQWHQRGFGDLPEGPFDLVLCALVLCHLADIAGPVGEMAARLAPHGRLVVSDFHYLCHAIGWRTGFRLDDRRYQIENYPHDYGQFVRAFRAAGLTIIAIEDILLDDALLDHGMDGAVSAWRGFPLCMVVVGQRA